MINQVPTTDVFEGLFSIIAAILFIIGFSLTVLIYKKKKNLTTVFLMLFMISGFFYSFSNIFDKFQLWEEAEEFGYAFIVLFATIFLIIGLVVILEEKLQSSERSHRQALIRANFYKDLFSHDMSNIIQNIISSLELYFSDPKALEQSKDAIKFLEVIEEQSSRGAELISNVRKLSKMDESETKAKPVDASPILSDTVNYVKRSYHNRNVQIHSVNQSANTIIYANEFLTDIFENILINAIIHNENTIKEIRIKISEEENEITNFLKIEFTDNGKGISDTRKNTIFQRDFNHEIHTSGMGIGLSLVKEIVESYNGKIHVEDRVNGDYTKGVNFILKFPLVS